MVDLGFDPGSSKFVCPNDRQLALRAKLKTGWSVKTSGYKSTPAALKDDEHNAIVDVIKRAERLEMMEQERVGKLIERLENMRRNVIGRSSSQCLLCGDRFGILGSPKAKCIDCQRFVCQKCAIDANTMKQRSPGKDSWLCMICSETREIWKKSGAWFFKSLPKYTIPSQKSYRNSRYKNYDDESSSDEERNFFKLQSRRGSNTESAHEFVETLPEPFSRQVSAVESFNEEVSALNLEENVGGESGNGSQASRESFASRSASELNWSESKRSSSICSISSSVFKGMEEKKIDATMGTIELALTYHPDNLTLHCSVYRAKNLIPMDINGLADPFCKLNILPDAKTYTRLRTKTVHKSRNPEFNENLTFYEINEKDLAMKSLHVLVLDDDKYGHDYMGEANIPLAKLRVQNTIYKCCVLYKSPTVVTRPRPVARRFVVTRANTSLVVLQHKETSPPSRCHPVHQLTSDGQQRVLRPFRKTPPTPRPVPQKHKTTIKWKNLNPNFNEEFAFETRLTELSTQSLFLTVWDKDYGKSNDYLGGLVLGGLGSKGQRLKHWLDMIHYPDHRHESWHNLTEDMLD